MKKFVLVLGVALFCFRTYCQPIYEELPEIGKIEVILHPGSTITNGSTHLVSFGVPFPRNTVNNISQILITDEQGNELASDIKELIRWHSLSDNPSVNGVRAALLYMNIQFNDLNPKTINVRYGQNRTLEIGNQADVKDNWVVVNDPEDEYNDDPNDPRYIEIREPSVYATLSPEWMSICVIRNKFIPTNQVSPDYQWYDEALVNFGKTAINDVSDTVLDEFKIEIDSPRTDSQGPWLFDRGGCLWNVYMKTGELKWLKASHRATQFYAANLNADGWFNPKGWDDLKYSFSGSMVIDLMLTGDIALRDKIIAIADLAERKNFLLNGGYNFWTERHFTYWLLGPLSAFEATGEEKYKTLTNERAAHAFFRAKNPINGYSPEGGLIHPMGPHEGANDPRDEPEFLPDGTPNPNYDPNDLKKGYLQPIISPWLSALMADAFWRYYLHSEDEEALRFLIGLGENIAEHCIYTVEGVNENINGNIQPYYLWSGQTNDRFRENQIYWKPWDDNEHAQDVMVLLARARWAQKKLKLVDNHDIDARINELLVTSKYTIEKWTRTEPTRPKYRLTPPRKFNWLFGTTTDYEWLMTNEPEDDVLSTNEFEGSHDAVFSVQPNPTSGNVSISVLDDASFRLGKIVVYDLNGRKIQSMTTVGNINNSNLNIQSLPSGIYFVKITTEGAEKTFKIIKK